MKRDVVPGMAEAIDKRRLELGLSMGGFAKAAGLTRAGLAPVVNGERRDYQDKTRFGLARALHWPVDALDRLMAGEDPATFEHSPPKPTVEARLAQIEQQITAAQVQLDQLARRLASPDAQPPARPLR